MFARWQYARAVSTLRHSTLTWQRTLKTLRILGIETSCDDTAAAIVSSDRVILSEASRSQQDLHEPMGGIVPTLASLGHSRHLPNVICRVLDQANMSVQDLDAIAVTRGPGLPPCLPVGLNAAKTLAAVHKLPLIGVHHMEAHALTARLATTHNDTPPEFPFMTLLISGGHTLLLRANAIGDYDLLAWTIDTAVGEAIDKTTRLLNLDWVKGPGGGPGAALERAAAQGNADRFFDQLPIPMLQRNKTVARFSFSGLKSSVARLVEQGDIIQNIQDRNDLAAAFQMVCIRHIEQKLRLVLDNNNKPLNALVVSGGVASNQLFRSRLDAIASDYGLPCLCPPPQLCTDNGAMIAWAGIERLRAGLVDDYTITTLPKWPLDTLKDRKD